VAKKLRLLPARRLRERWRPRSEQEQRRVRRGSGGQHGQEIGRRAWWAGQVLYYTGKRFGGGVSPEAKHPRKVGSRNSE
jgi:hypothetical protein